MMDLYGCGYSIRKAMIDMISHHQLTNEQYKCIILYRDEHDFKRISQYLNKLYKNMEFQIYRAIFSKRVVELESKEMLIEARKFGENLRGHKCDMVVMVGCYDENGEDKEMFLRLVELMLVPSRMGFKIYKNWKEIK